jgi:protein gp37
MSSIEWTDTTWNPLAGCTRASEGCDNCYAASMALRLEAMAKADIAAGKDPGRKAKYIGVATRNRRGVATFNGTIKIDEEALNEPRKWRKPRMVFVNSMSDLFHENVDQGFIDDVFNVMNRWGNHTYQVLTKRPERAADYINRVWPDLATESPNVWIGTSVENQATADERIPYLLQIPASVRFLSLEPLLGEVDLRSFSYGSRGGLEEGHDWLTGEEWQHSSVFGGGNSWLSAKDKADYGSKRIHWIIAGGESGHNARPMKLGWVRSIRDQCAEAGVKFFFKQWGEYLSTEQMSEEFYDAHITQAMEPIYDNTDGGWLYRVGKKNAGRLLDGRVWNETPEQGVP